jgi:UDP-N-acetylmuramoyl-L-alanyl-D-glutamate--2,6-diaminopimelate ligase
MIRPELKPSISFATIAKLIGADFDQDIEITGIAQSAADIEPGDIFLALPGAKHHGIDFLDQAISNGAVAVITDQKGSNQALPTLVVNNPRRFAGDIASVIYGEPSQNMFAVGVTGTNGKTTVTTLLHQIWQRANWDSGLIGTVNTQINSEILPSTHTTPEAAPLQAIIATMKERHCRAVAMEVSSHALDQYRVSGAHFKVAGFTNLTQDHLDFHGDMDSYFKAKSKLFAFGFSDLAVINIDDAYGAKLANSVEIPVIKVSRTGKADWRYEEITHFGSSTQIKIRGLDGVLIEGTTSLIGDFNLDNLLLAVAIAVISGVDPIEISVNLPIYTGAPGRLEQVNVGQDFLAFVDYAHTPDAVVNVLKSARAMIDERNGRVIAVLGCGGDRDKTKRPLMGKALTAADFPIFTSDNPRSEDPAVILNEMVAGISHSGEVIADRQKAIEKAVSLAKPGDVIAVLGKGHESGQEIAGVKHPFDDRKVLAHAIASLK